MKTTGVLVAGVVAGTVLLVRGATRTVDFSDGVVGQAPKGFEFGLTGKVGAPGEGRTYGKSAPVPTGRWSTLRLVATGSRFEVHYNGAKLYQIEDTTFTQPGKVGIWTKADSVTQFDDLTVVTR